MLEYQVSLEYGGANARTVLGMYTGTLLEADLSGTALTLCGGDEIRCAEAFGECRVTAETIGRKSAELSLSFSGNDPALIQSVLDTLLDGLEDAVRPAVLGLGAHEGGRYGFELDAALAEPLPEAVGAGSR